MAANLFPSQLQGPTIKCVHCAKVSKPIINYKRMPTVYFDAFIT